MARQSSDREDLMAEAITLLPRIQFLVPNSSDEIVAGQRADGRWSIFFGGDPVYHFDAQHRLRRAFVDGLLYRSQGQTLARLTRQESTDSTVLLRHDLTDHELTAFFQMLRDRLLAIARAIDQNQVQLQKSYPPDANYLPVLSGSIDQVLKSDNLLSPAIANR